MARGGGGRGGRGGGGMPREVQVSKKLSWLLRHGAENEGLTLGEGGYVGVKDVLNSRSIRPLKVTFPELRELVATNDKQRYSLIPLPSLQNPKNPPTSSHDPPTDNLATTLTLSEPSAENIREPAQEPDFDRDDPSNFLIRANQGHTLKVQEPSDAASNPELALLTPITLENLPPICVHGTRHSAWPVILASGGLKPMRRNHVHFAAGLPEGLKEISDARDDGQRQSRDDQETPTDREANHTRDSAKGADAEEPSTQVQEPVISGMRTSSQILIYIDLPLALSRGIPFFRSANNVILSPGDPKTGLVSTDFFEKVEDRKEGAVLMRDGKVVTELDERWLQGKDRWDSGGRGRGRSGRGTHGRGQRSGGSERRGGKGGKAGKDGHGLAEAMEAFDDVA